MAESVVSTTIIGIGNLLIQEAQFLGAVPGKVEQLQTEMKRIQRFLKDADKRQDESESVRGWVSEIRELAYDAEDVVANFIAKAALRGEKAFFRQLIRCACIFSKYANLYNVGVEIDDIMAKIANLTNSLQTYGIHYEGEASTSHRLQQLQEFRRARSFVIEDQLVGLVDDTKVLLDKIVGHDHKHHQHVISICGMGGIGKTTLARKLYHHDEVKRHFDAFAWISVSQTFETRKLLDETLLKLTSSSNEQKEKISKMSNDEVAKELYQIQQNRKCLVILDDIWSEEAWDAIRHAFPIEKMVGIIVLTTRSKILGLHVDPNCYIHESQCLSEDQSLELFRQKAFLRRDYEGSPKAFYTRGTHSPTGAMASLCHLRICDCKKLKMVPEGMKYINTLSQLDIHWMPEEFKNRVKVIDGEEGEDYYKVRHVPSISIIGPFDGV